MTERNFRIVPGVVFIYDCFRLFFIMALLMLFLKPGTDHRALRIPFVMFASPNAFFPLMSFFLCIRFDASKAFIPLYITGKALSVLCAGVWVIVLFQAVFAKPDIIWVVFLCAADLGTVMGMATGIPRAPREFQGGE